MTDGRNVIPAGPGFIGPVNAPNEYSADVELELVYGPKGDTVASLILFATDVEAPWAELAIGAELTKGDLVALIGWAEGMIEASEEDK